MLLDAEEENPQHYERTECNYAQQKRDKSVINARGADTSKIGEMERLCTRSKR